MTETFPQIPSFEIVERLQSDCNAVYRGLFEGEKCIIKIFDSKNSNSLDEFEILQQLSKINHTSYRFPKPIAKIHLTQAIPIVFERYYDYKLCNEYVLCNTIIVIEYIEGTPLNEFDISDNTQIFYDLLNIVLYLRNNGILHNDIDDGNIIITPDMKVVIIDFGMSFSKDCSIYTLGFEHKIALYKYMADYEIYTIYSLARRYSPKLTDNSDLIKLILSYQTENKTFLQLIEIRGEFFQEMRNA